MKHHKITHIVLAVYIVLSAGFIGLQTWDYLKGSVYAAGVSDGQTSAVVQLMNEANKCEPFTVFAGEAEIQLQKLECEAPVN